MGRNRNKNLFWYGFWANIKKGLGSLIFMGGCFFSLMGWAGNSTGVLAFGVGGILLGGYFIATGSSQRFDYQRQSGSLIHRGDW